MRSQFPLFAPLVVVLALALPGSAAASSIVFTRGPDVWLTTPDGSRQAQVTHAGAGDPGFAAPSQADDGTIVALKADNRFHRFAPSGRPIGDPVALWLGDGRSGGFRGPYSPRVSPDGTKVAYGYAYSRQVCEGGECIAEGTDGTAYTYSDRYTELGELGHFREWANPAWIGNQHTIAFNPGAGLIGNPDHVNVAFDEIGPDPVGGTSPLFKWFDDPQQPYLDFGALSRAGDKLIVGEGLGKATRLLLYSVPAAPPAPASQTSPPTSQCQLSGDGEKPFTDVSWAPDGSAAAYGYDGGVWTVAVADLTQGCAAVSPPVRIADGLTPFWGVTDIGADAGTYRPPVGGGNDIPGGGSGSATLTLAASRGQRLRRALGRGLTIRVRTSAPGTVTARATIDRRLARRLHLRRAVAGATRRLTKPGEATVTLRFSARARRALRTQRSLRLTLNAAGAGGRATTTVRLRR